MTLAVSLFSAFTPTVVPVRSVAVLGDFFGRSLGDSAAVIPVRLIATVSVLTPLIADVRAGLI